MVQILANEVDFVCISDRTCRMLGLARKMGTELLDKIILLLRDNVYLKFDNAVYKGKIENAKGIIPKILKFKFSY